MHLHSDALKQLVEIFLREQKRLVLTKYSHFYSLLPCCKQFLIREADGVRFQMLDVVGGKQRGGASKPDTGSSKSWEINGFMLCVRHDQPNFTSKNSHMAGLWECRKESKCSLGHVPSCHFPHIVRLRPDVTVCSTRPTGRRLLPQETWARPRRSQHRGDQPTLGSRHGISLKQTGRRGHEDSSIQRHTCVHDPHQIPTEPPTGH